MNNLIGTIWCINKRLALVVGVSFVGSYGGTEYKVLIDKKIERLHESVFLMDWAELVAR